MQDAVRALNREEERARHVEAPLEVPPLGCVRDAPVPVQVAPPRTAALLVEDVIPDVAIHSSDVVEPSPVAGDLERIAARAWRAGAVGCGRCVCF